MIIRFEVFHNYLRYIIQSFTITNTIAYQEHILNGYVVMINNHTYRSDDCLHYIIHNCLLISKQS